MPLLRTRVLAEPEKRFYLLRLSVLGLLLVGPVVLHRYQLSWLAVCWFQKLTGIPCPTCGLVRSFENLAVGDLAGAAQLHPLGPLIFMIFALYALHALSVLLFRRHWEFTILSTGKLFGALMGMLVLVWGLRIFIEC